MKTQTYALCRSAHGFGVRIKTAAGDTVEYPCVSYRRKAVRCLIGRLSGARLDPVHFDDVVRDFITEQYFEQLALNGLV